MQRLLANCYITFRTFIYLLASVFQCLALIIVIVLCLLQQCLQILQQQFVLTLHFVYSWLLSLFLGVVQLLCNRSVICLVFGNVYLLFNIFLKNRDGWSRFFLLWGVELSEQLFHDHFFMWTILIVGVFRISIYGTSFHSTVLHSKMLFVELTAYCYCWYTAEVGFSRTVGDANFGIEVRFKVLEKS